MVCCKVLNCVSHGLEPDLDGAAHGLSLDLNFIFVARVYCASLCLLTCLARIDKWSVPVPCRDVNVNKWMGQSRESGTEIQ